MDKYASYFRCYCSSYCHGYNMPGKHLDIEYGKLFRETTIVCDETTWINSKNYSEFRGDHHQNFQQVFFFFFLFIL